MSASPSPRDLARSAGLVHVSDEDPGIRRIRRGRGFSYHTPSRDLIQAPEERERLAALAIPPAWTEVWISPDPDGHIQATGRDAEGRKQYRYHPKWIEEAARNKFGRMGSFGRALPRIRRRVRRDLGREGLPREKVLAVLTRLLDRTGLRIGTETSGPDHGAYGLTTLRKKHLSFNDNGVLLRFRGKGGKAQEVAVSDARLTRILQSCHDVTGHELFQYLDGNGERHPVDAEEVNEYIRAVAQEDFTARDFRTWVGSLQAFEALEQCPTPDSDDDRKRTLVQILDAVAETLNNTPAVCREYYVHPLLVEACLDASLPDLLAQVNPEPVRELRKSETAFLALLENRSFRSFR